jgi:hypothetical protein
LCGSCVRWPADLLEPLPHVRGEVPQTDHYPPPQRGETGILSWLVVLRYGISRLFTGGAGRRRLFGAFLLFSGFLYAFDSLAGAFDSPFKRGTSRYGSDPPPKRVHAGKQRVAQMVSTGLGTWQVLRAQSCQTRVGLCGRPCVALHRVPHAWARDVGGLPEARAEVRARRSRVASCMGPAW